MRIARISATRLTLVASAALAASTVTASHAVASPYADVPPPPVTIDVESIFGNQTASAWTELVVSLTNRQPLTVVPPAAIDGVLELYDGSYPPHVGGKDVAAARVIHRRALSLPPNERTVVQLPVQAGHAYEARFRYAGGTEMAFRSSISVPEAKERIYLEANSPISAAYSGVVRRIYPAQVGYLSVFPEHAATYHNVVALMTGWDMASSLRGARCDALVSWIREGGSAAVVRSDEGDVRTHKTELPCSLDRHEVLEESADAVTFKVGSGRATLATRKHFQPAQVDALFAGAMKRAMPHYQFSDFGRFERRDYQPRVSLAGGIMLVFLLASGPLLYARLRRRQKVDRVLSLAPLLSLTAFGTLFACGYAFREGPHTMTLSFREFASGEKNGSAVIARGFINPTGPLTVRPLLADARLSAVDPWMYDRGQHSVQPDGTVLINQEGRHADYVYLVESGAATMPGPVTIHCSRQECFVDNESGVPITRAALYRPYQGVIEIGRIDRRGSFRLEAGTKIAPIEEQILTARPLGDDFDPTFLSSRVPILVGVQRFAGDDHDTHVRIACTGCGDLR